MFRYRAGGVAGAASVLVVLLWAGGRVDAEPYHEYGGVSLPRYDYQAAGDGAGDDYRERADYDKDEEPRPPPSTPTTPARAPRRRHRADHRLRTLHDASDYQILDDKYSNEDVSRLKSKYKRRRSKERRDVSEELTRALVGGRRGGLEPEGRGGRGRRGGDLSEPEYELAPSEDELYPHGMDETGADETGADRPGADRRGADRPGTNRPGAGKLAPRPPPSHPPTPREDHYDSYDMKRIYKLKNKLPSLLRRTTPSSALTEPVPGAPPARRRWPADREPVPSATATTSTTTSTTTTSSTAQYKAEPHKILSLAEKSKRSILKKAMLKEGGAEGAASKPPVLLQVSGATPTIMLLERQGSSLFPESQRRYLPDLEDSPSRLAAVKRVMRERLLGRARGISDLANNWDEMVCDYVDTALIDSRAAPAILAAPAACYLLAAALTRLLGVL